MVLPPVVQAAAVPHGDTAVVTEHVAPVAGAAFHAGCGVLAGGGGVEVGAGGRAGRGAFTVVAVWRAGESCSRREEAEKGCR